MSDARRDALAASVEALATEVAALNTQLEESTRKVDTLAEGTTALSARSRLHTWWIVGGSISLLLDVVFTIVIFVFYDQQSQLLAAQEQTTTQLTSSIRNQCGLLSLFLGSYRPESRPPADRDEYEAAFVMIRAQYRDLRCVTPFVPPATTPAPTPKPTETPR